MSSPTKSQSKDHFNNAPRRIRGLQQMLDEKQVDPKQEPNIRCVIELYRKGPLPGGAGPFTMFQDGKVITIEALHRFSPFFLELPSSPRDLTNAPLSGETDGHDYASKFHAPTDDFHSNFLPFVQEIVKSESSHRAAKRCWEFRATVNQVPRISNL